ncbi:MAG: DUF4990 domain-containing protein [Chitinispirillaceae bacterium]|nr:DUF4990 domain-containing protein [Chitinispirillaceae bacterium]
MPRAKVPFISDIFLKICCILTSIQIIRNSVTDSLFISILQIYFNGAIRNCDGAGIDASHNSWQISNVKVSADDFLSIDTAGVSGPRKDDGSLPDVNFLRLAKGSDLIDKGIDIGLSFLGKAPDIGAFEYNDAAFAIIQSGNDFTAQPFTIHPPVFNNSEPVLFDLSGRRLLNNVFQKSASCIVSAPGNNNGQSQSGKIIHMH